jgi:hypothetical protein
MGVSYLVMDAELKTLLEKFSQYHPEGSREVLKVVLKLYLKLVDKSRRKGKDQLLILQNLVERIVTGNLYETTQDRIDHMDSILEERQITPGNSDSAYLHKEINEIKDLLRGLQFTGTGPVSALPSSSMRKFSPKDAAKLLDVNSTEGGEKKRKSYRELRKESAPKKIDF